MGPIRQRYSVSCTSVNVESSSALYYDSVPEALSSTVSALLSSSQCCNCLESSLRYLHSCAMSGNLVLGRVTTLGLSVTMSLVTTG